MAKPRNNNDNDNTTLAPPSPAQLEAALTSLTTAAHILDGFAHRNRNQHRAARWWAAFSMLRRSLHKTLPDLDDAVRRAEDLSSLGLAASPKQQPELDAVSARAGWVRGELAARCYEAFTQLAADRQFAQLGLVLIGVLAQVQAAAAPLVPAAPSDGEEATGRRRTESGTRVQGEAVPRAAVSSPALDVGGSEDDLGVAVSRDEVGEADHHVRPSVGRASSPSLEERPVAGEEQRGERVKTRKRKRPEAEESSSTTGKRKALPPRVESKEGDKTNKKKKKKKKERRGGDEFDEFDDLFSSIL